MTAEGPHDRSSPAGGRPAPAARLVARSWPDVGRPVVFVPVGSTEQHGPHLPLDTDTLVASVVATELAARLTAAGTDAVVAPAIAYGASGEHQGFPGTVSIGTEALAFLLLEYGRSASSWFDRVVFVNGHGGNVEALARSVPVLVSEQRAVAWVPCVPGPDATRDGIPVDAHAGRSETSVLLAIDEARVHVDRLHPGNSAPIRELIGELRAGGVRAIAPDGVLGDPTEATAGEGRTLLRSMVEEAWSRLRSGRIDERGCLVAGVATPDPTIGAVS
ncbi:mycofactocin biosynthesis peptidyl-dipeptidase MftE [Agromyces sp. Marseille-P2726]|uniref:mycofactocin biosynthesis peptidyl-dipeptidase MftE n=1 Tax=Agromyces sp. Marseille-P2726 TaxID=2709132 RepID=UPI001C2D6E6E|nr:mycofactocin biosynthesis peptidyl-dipeptidase MftE [Agromyces sp. Marseille-P2726]